MKKFIKTRILISALVILVFAAIIAGYFSITRYAGSITQDAKIVPIIIIISVLSLSFAAVVVQRAVKLWSSLKSGSVGSRLQSRLVSVFSIITILPTIVVSLFSISFFNLGIQSWFDERVSTALQESVAVSKIYLDEHKYTIRGDAIAMADDIDRELDNNPVNENFINNLVNTQTVLRSLSEAAIFQKGNIIARSQLAFSLAFEHIPANDIALADRGDIVVNLEGDDKVRALIKLKSLHAPDTYLLIGRIIDNKVVKHVSTADSSVEQYQRLKKNISSKQLEFSLVFVLFAAVLLFSAILYAMYFAAKIISPIGKLINASERVRAGDFTAKVAEGPKNDEIGTLARAFNRMTDELEKQRKDLVEINRQLDTRRRFSEAVLSGVSAGIIALNKEKIVTLANPVAANLLLLAPDAKIKGELITEIVPEFAELFSGSEENAEITITHGDKTRVLHVRIVLEKFAEEIEGYIVTFDDITELLVAQRKAAWSDVARRVAHEIKNPLTPIQLAAERLKKKYLPQILEESDTYVRYLDTISRHVGDIGKIVDEFVSFARMPAPTMKPEDITSIINKVVFSEQTTHAEIEYNLIIEQQPIFVLCDEQQISRVFLNLLKNAAEAFENFHPEKPTIKISCTLEGNNCKLQISDNGPGFPPDKMKTLFEPYMTTRAKGTGLGLSIVKKIIDDHKASLTLDNLPEGGAGVTIVFAVYEE